MVPVVNSYHNAAAAAVAATATTIGQASQPNATRTYQQTTSPGPNGQTDIYNHSSPEQSYVQATSPQPNNGFQALAINRVSNAWPLRNAN